MIKLWLYSGDGSVWIIVFPLQEASLQDFIINNSRRVRVFRNAPGAPTQALHRDEAFLVLQCSKYLFRYRMMRHAIFIQFHIHRLTWSNPEADSVIIRPNIGVPRIYLPPRSKTYDTSLVSLTAMRTISYFFLF